MHHRGLDLGQLVIVGEEGCFVTRRGAALRVKEVIYVNFSDVNLFTHVMEDVEHVQDEVHWAKFSIV